MFLGAVFTAVIFPGIPVMTFFPVFTLVVIDIWGVHKINAGGMVAVVPALVMRGAIITIISAASIVVAVISGIIPVLISRLHRLFRIAFGLSRSALGL